MIKVSAGSRRDQELEDELQGRVAVLLADPRYKGLPILIMRNLEVMSDKTGVEIDISSIPYNLIGNYFSKGLKVMTWKKKKIN